MKNSEIIPMVITGTIVLLCIAVFLIYLINFCYKLKQENILKDNIILAQSKTITKKEEVITQIEKDFEENYTNYKKLRIETNNKDREYNELYKEKENNNKTYLKHQAQLQETIEKLNKDLEIEKSLNEKHLETIDSLVNKAVIYDNEDFYLCLLEVYKNFCNPHNKIDKRIKGYKDFIKTKKEIENLIDLLTLSSIDINIEKQKETADNILENLNYTAICNYTCNIDKNNLVFVLKF